ncbi:MAG: hypothetical protein D6795_14085 [Deltaproteobacteria bacterium]|nr:MAG: hypothetical protein D6795_14085 [Deltaproteobacteria bacterium]
MEVILFRQCVYKLLASLFLDPTEERVARIKGLCAHLTNMLDMEEISERYREALFPFLERISGAVFDRSLREEFVALFIADLERFCAPYEGAHVNGSPEYTIPLPILLLEREYAREGLLAARNELPDHVAVELEFLSYLCGKEITAAQEGGDRERIAEAQRRFIERHLALWFPSFARMVAQKTDTLYKEVVRFADTFLRLDLGDLRNRPDHTRLAPPRLEKERALPATP